MSRTTQVEVDGETSGAPVNWAYVAVVLGGALVVTGGVIAVKKYGPDGARLWEKHAAPRIDAVKRRFARTPDEQHDGEAQQAEG